MQNFIILSLAKAKDSPLRAIMPSVTGAIDRLGLTCESLTAETTESGQPRLSGRVEAARGVVLLYCESAGEELERVLETCHSALASKPVALIASASRQRIREVVAALTVDHGAFCGPRSLTVNREDLDDRGALRADAAEQARSLIDDFVIFCRAIGYFEMNCTQLEEQIEAAARQYEVALDSMAPNPLLQGLRVNHLNVMAKNLEESLAFYVDVLGAKYVCHLGPRKVVTSLNGFELFIQEADQFEVDENAHVGVRTDREGVLAFVSHLRGLGVPLVVGSSPLDRPHLAIDGERAAIYFRDPAGLLIEVYSPEAMTLRIDEAERKNLAGGERPNVG